jgi:hypothetical protein
MAQAVYSVNYVGYVNKTLSSGYTMIANPLNNGNNQLQTIIPTAPDGTVAFKYSGGFESATYFAGTWVVGGDLVLAPGEGFFVQNPGPATTITFVGEGMEGPGLANAIPAGLSIKASKIPQAGSLTQLEFPVAGDGDVIHKWNATATPQGYSSYTHFGGAWFPEEPSFDVAEGFWVSATAPLNWVRNFEVTP